jgi:hypothetical protein
MRIEPDTPAHVDELQEWLDSIASRQWSDSEIAAFDEPPAADIATQVDLAAGEFFRATWRRRLADAQGDFGYVARQMRKAGVPLDLALAVLLAPDPSATSPRAALRLLEVDDDYPTAYGNARAFAERGSRDAVMHGA